MPYVYSTLTAPQRYLNYKDGGGDLPVAVGDGVLIAGGSNTVDKYERQTIPGVRTEVTPAELSYLLENEVFKAHKANGFLVISDKKEDGEVVAADMVSRGGDAPLQPEDFDDAGPKPEAVEPTPAPTRGGRRA